LQEDVKEKKKKGFLQTIGLKGSGNSSMKSVVPQAIMGNKAAKQSNYQGFYRLLWIFVTVTIVIHEAVKSGNTKKVSDLLRDGISVNTIDDKGLSPLHQAVLKGNLDMVRLLLWKDADVDLRTPTGWTALHEAAKNSTLEIVDILLHKGANPNAETADGVSPLHYLVSRKFTDSILHKEVTLPINYKLISRS
jgi:ankyrin repeat protein